jgi:hypothetical protein
MIQIYDQWAVIDLTYIKMTHKLKLTHDYVDEDEDCRTDVYFHTATINDCVKVCDAYFKYLQLSEITHQVNKEVYGFMCENGPHVGITGRGTVGNTGFVGFTGDYQKPVYQSKCACGRHTLTAYLIPIKSQ